QERPEGRELEPPTGVGTLHIPSIRAPARALNLCAGAARRRPEVARWARPGGRSGLALQRRTLTANKPCGLNIKIAITVSNVSTFAMEPVMKNSVVAWACAMLKAEAMVPIRLSAPPNTTTRNVSTM